MHRVAHKLRTYQLTSMHVSIHNHTITQNGAVGETSIYLGKRGEAVFGREGGSKGLLICLSVKFLPW